MGTCENILNSKYVSENMSVRKYVEKPCLLQCWLKGTSKIVLQNTAH